MLVYFMAYPINSSTLSVQNMYTGDCMVPEDHRIICTSIDNQNICILYDIWRWIQYRYGKECHRRDI